MRCPRCAHENEENARFCSRCGLDMVEAKATADVAPDEVLHCYRHPKRETLLRCGRCERPICEKCAVIGPAGQRCPECAKSNVAFRPGAVGLEVKRGFRSMGRVSPWTWIVGLMLVGGLIRGCNAVMGSMRPQQPVQIQQQQQSDESDSSM